MNAYGFYKKITESECVAELMNMYQKLTGSSNIIYFTKEQIRTLT